MIPFKLTIMAALWAGGFIVAKIISPQAGPFTITCLRFFAVTAVLAALIYRRGDQFTLRPAHWGYALGAAVLGVLCYNYFFMAGIRLVDAGRGSVIISTVPIAVAIFSHLFSREKIGPLKALGFVVSIAGTWVVISHGRWEQITGPGMGRGEFYFVLCVLCASAFALFSKALLNDLSPMVTMALVSAAGALFAVIPAIMETKSMPVPWGSWTFLTGLAYLAVGPSVIAVIFYYEAMNVIGAARASQYMNLIPVFAVVLGMIFLGEHITASLMVGGGLVTLGLYLARGEYELLRRVDVMPSADDGLMKTNIKQ